MSRIAIFGSAFNPPSLGHKSVIDSLQHFDQIWLVPSISHAWGKQMLDFDFRCQLVEAFINDLANPDIRLCTEEQRLFDGDNSVTTFDLLSHLQAKHADCQFTFVMGPDNLLNFAKFYKADEILSRWSVLTCPEVLPVRSTQIREALAQSKPIRHLVTPAVAEKLTLSDAYSG